MNDVDAPRADEPSASAGSNRPAESPVRLVAAGAGVTALALLALACLALGPLMGRAETPVGRAKIRLPHELGNPPVMAIREPTVSPVRDALVRPSDAEPVRSVQPLPFVRPIADPPAKRDEQTLARPSDAGPVRSVQPLPFIRPIVAPPAKRDEQTLVRPSDAEPVRSVQPLPFVRPIPAPPAERGEASPVRPVQTRRSELVQTEPLRSIKDLPLRLSRNGPIGPRRGAAVRSVVRAEPLTPVRPAPAKPTGKGTAKSSPAAPLHGSQDPCARAVQSRPLRPAEAAPFGSVQVSLVRPVEGGPVRSVQNVPFGAVRGAPPGRSHDPPTRPSREAILGPSEDGLVSTFGGLLGEAEPRSPLGAGAIELEGPFRKETGERLQAGKREGRPDGERPAGPPPASTIDHPPIGCLTVDIRSGEKGPMPPDDAAKDYRAMSEVAVGPALGRGWSRRMYLWEASSFCHRPLYFEEINLERYGFFCCDHRCGGIPSALVQPVLSGAHFFASVPALPYKMTLDPPCECIYTLGHYRPGSCVPHRIHRIPLRPLPAAAEACVITGLVFAIP